MIKVALVGRTNVGKSTLFNRLTGRKKAIVHSAPNVTRDRKEETASLGGYDFLLIDTAGIDEDAFMFKETLAQTEKALDESDVVFMIVDAKAGLSPLDHMIAKMVRSLHKPAFLLANKTENPKTVLELSEFYKLGLKDPLPIAAEHALGMGEIYEALEPFFLKDSPPDDEEETFEEPEESVEPEQEETSAKAIKVTIVGRPNVGKSTLINRLVGEDRLITGETAGITRDSISIPWTYGGRDLLLTDTAGLRRKSKVIEDVEKMSAAGTKKMINQSHVVILLLDSTEDLDRQDLKIAGTAIEEGRVLLVALNKWDQVETKPERLKGFKAKLEYSLSQVKDLPVFPISGLEGTGLKPLLTGILKYHDLWNTHVATARLNRFLKGMIEANPPPLSKTGRHVPLKYMTQSHTRPPTFVIFSSNPEPLPDSYVRYLLNGLRKAFRLPGIPLRLMLRKRENPFAKAKRK